MKYAKYVITLITLTLGVFLFMKRFYPGHEDFVPMLFFASLIIMVFVTPFVSNYIGGNLDKYPVSRYKHIWTDERIRGQWYYLDIRDLDGGQKSVLAFLFVSLTYGIYLYLKNGNFLALIIAALPLMVIILLFVTINLLGKLFPILVESAQMYREGIKYKKHFMPWEQVKYITLNHFFASNGFVYGRGMLLKIKMKDGESHFVPIQYIKPFIHNLVKLDKDNLFDRTGKGNKYV